MVVTPIPQKAGTSTCKYLGCMDYRAQNYDTKATIPGRCRYDRRVFRAEGIGSASFCVIGKDVVPSQSTLSCSSGQRQSDCVTGKDGSLTFYKAPGLEVDLILKGSGSECKDSALKAQGLNAPIRLPLKTRTDAKQMNVLTSFYLALKNDYSDPSQHLCTYALGPQVVDCPDVLTKPLLELDKKFFSLQVTGRDVGRAIVHGGSWCDLGGGPRGPPRIWGFTRLGAVVKWVGSGWRGVGVGMAGRDDRVCRISGRAHFSHSSDLCRAGQDSGVRQDLQELSPAQVHLV